MTVLHSISGGKFKLCDSEGKGLANIELKPGESIVIQPAPDRTWKRCPKCSGTGLLPLDRSADLGYCDCSTGKDLRRLAGMR
jgi:hypothetical protein